MSTDGLTIPSNLHNITPEQVMFVYNTSKTGSLEVAEYYRDQRDIPNSNLVGLPITVPTASVNGLTCESVDLNEADYLYQIENPLIDALDNLGTNFSTSGARTIWVIILGYGIPLAYDDNGETIAIASRLHRLGQTVDHKYANHTYDRRGQFKFFDEEDAGELFITSVIDGPTVDACKDLIDRSLDVDNQTFITGDVFIDPYGLQVTSADQQYEQDILDFISNEFDNLGLDSQVTVDPGDPYQEATVQTLERDSFYWGWFNPTYSRQLFLNQNERRVFLYNADDRSACNIHFYKSGSPFDENGSDHWCNLAINVDPGYATCAGSVADPGSDAFLRPTPFFQALHQGATVGEAFLFASPFVDWKTVLIGDPLMVVNFPVDIPSEQDTSFTLLPNDEVILRTKLVIEESIAWGDRQTRMLTDVVNHVVESHDFSEEINLLLPMADWNELKSESAQTNIYAPIVNQWGTYVNETTNQSVSLWLQDKNEKITQRMRDVLRQTGTQDISDQLLLSPGSWQFIFTYNHPLLTREDIHFELEIATDENFDSSSIVIDLSTLTDTTGWSYEGQPYIFVQLPTSGFPSNFSGRRVKFVSQVAHYLTTTGIYYARWTATDDVGAPIEGATATQRIIISA